MINLDNVKTGDILTIEVEVATSNLTEDIWINAEYVRRNGKDCKDVKVVGYKAALIPEPNGLGAVVQGTWGNTYRWVRVGTDSERPWQTVGLSYAEYPWDVLQKKCADLEVLSEGFEG